MRPNDDQKNIRQLSAALYMRLSRDDGELSESSSIENQRKILRNYAKDNGFIVFDEYIDDGYTGTDFDRPAFIRLKDDITSGKIGTVLTKDFSRLGRNTGQVMTMLDDFFVRNGVRYVSITEGIDTFASDVTGMLAPMLSFTNELYSGDISRKINASFSVKMREGEYIGAFAPYGYKKDPMDKNHLVPDEQASKIVKRVFALAKDGYSPNQIANILNDECVLTPLNYRIKFSAFSGKMCYDPERKWRAETVSKILRNEFYLGHTVQGKTHKPSFKSKHIINVPKDEWIRVENTHIALIDADTWSIVRKKMKSRAMMREKGFVNLFSGIARCSDCGRNMSTVGTRKKGARANLNCGGYKQYGSKACLSHSIDYDVLYDIVLEAIKKQINYTEQNQEILIAKMLEKERCDTARLYDTRKKLFNVSNKLALLYDKKFSGEIDQISFETLKEKYEAEKLSFEHIIAKEEKVCAEKNEAKNIAKRKDDLEKLIEDYADLKHLDSDILFNLIDRIDVHQGEYRGREKHQRIDIYFKFRTKPDEFQILK